MSVAGSYWPPVFKKVDDDQNTVPPPQTIIRLPVQIAVCPQRAAGASEVDVFDQVSDGVALVGSTGARSGPAAVPDGVGVVVGGEGATAGGDGEVGAALGVASAELESNEPVVADP